MSLIFYLLLTNLLIAGWMVNESGSGEFCEDNDIMGCTDPAACNYNVNAECDDETCYYANIDCPDPCQTIRVCSDYISRVGCQSFCDIDGCVMQMMTCTDPCNVVFGCTDIAAINFNPDANCDDGSCLIDVVEEVDLQLTCQTEYPVTYLSNQYFQEVVFIFTVENTGTKDLNFASVDFVMPNQLQFSDCALTAGVFNSVMQRWDIGKVRLGIKYHCVMTFDILNLGKIEMMAEIAECDEILIIQ